MITSSMPWIKLYTEMLDDVKLSRLSDAQKWRFVQLLLLAGECDAEGALVTGDSPMTTEDVTWRLRIDTQTLVTDLEKLTELGLVHIEDGAIIITKFANRQGPTQAEKREQWKKRQKERRERLKGGSVTGDSRESHAPRVEKEKEREKEEEEEEEEEKDLPGASAPEPPLNSKKRGQTSKKQAASPETTTEVKAILSEWARLFPNKPQPHPATYRDKILARWKSPHFRDNWQEALERASASFSCQNESWFNFAFFVKNEENYQKMLDCWMKWKDDQAKKNGKVTDGAKRYLEDEYAGHIEH